MHHCSFLGFFSLGINCRSIVSAETLPEKKVPLAEISRVCHLECLQNKSEAYAESEACDSASIVPIHTRSEVSSDSDSASVASVASVNQPLEDRRTDDDSARFKFF